MSRTQKTVFAVPELVQLIYAYSKPRENAHLALTARGIFQIIIPLLWERVDGASQLFSLLPDAEEVKNGTSPVSASHQINIENLVYLHVKQTPDEYSEEDFSRFDVYGPFVKHLEVFGHGDSKYHENHSEALYRYSETHTLLPKLASITLTNGQKPADLFWVVPFLSPSLASLEYIVTTPLYQPELSLPASSILLHMLSEKCPNLQTLSVLPVPGGCYANDKKVVEAVTNKNKPKIKAKLEQGLSPFLSGVNTLVSLTTSSMILDESCLKTISTWPLLERLEIYMSPEKRYSLPDFDETSFPSLKHLGFHFLPNYEVFDMFWDVPVLVNKLTSVKILFDNVFFHGDPFELRLLSTLVERSPGVEHLWLRALDPDAWRAWHSTSASVIGDVLAKLPLQTLYIEGIEFEGRKDILEHLAETFPTLKALELRSQRADFKDLRYFAEKMPHLERLNLDIPYNTIPSVDLNEVPRYRLSAFRTFESNFHGFENDGSSPGVFSSLDSTHLAQ
jgi:hypothetical protein